MLTYDRRALAQAMGATPGRVSQIERSEVATIGVIARYIEPPGGRLDLVASFGDHTLTVAASRSPPRPLTPRKERWSDAQPRSYGAAEDIGQRFKFPLGHQMTCEARSPIPAWPPPRPGWTV